MKQADVLGKKKNMLILFDCGSGNEENRSGGWGWKFSQCKCLHVGWTGKIPGCWEHRPHPLADCLGP